MVENTKAIIMTIKSKAKDFSVGLMGEYTKDLGLMANSMELVFTQQ